MSGPRPPVVTVVIPAFNLARYLPAAVESALQQRVPDGVIDVLVVDDGSTDETPGLLASFGRRIRSLRQDNRGLPATRNRGVSASASEFLCFLDADDILLPGKIAAEVGLLRATPTIDIAYSGWHYIDESGARMPQRGWSREQGDLLPRLLLGNVIHPHAATVRRSAFERVGGFDETLTSVEDWDLWIRLSIAGSRWGAIDSAALEYRVRTDGMHANPGRMLTNRLRVLDKTFASLPGVRQDLQRLRGPAYANAHLEAAADWIRSGHIDEATGAFTAAVHANPEILQSPQALRGFARLFLPLGWRNDAVLADSWLDIAPRLRELVRAATAGAPLRQRLTARATLQVLSYRYWRKRVRRRLGGT